jgi:hypothetical protein
VSRLPLEAPPSGRWFIRLDRSAVAVGELAQRLAAAGAPAMHLRQAGSRIVACTAPAAWSDIRTALPPDAAAHVLCLPVLDAPASSDVPHDPSSSQETQS